MPIPQENQSHGDHPYGALVAPGQQAYIDDTPDPINGMSKPDIMQALAETIPLNDWGLPQFIYRPDLIPPNMHELSKVEQVRVAEMAKEVLNTFEGFPTLANGNPYWGKMSCESEASFQLFNIYLNLCEDANVHVRQLFKIIEAAQAFNIPTPTYEYLYELFHINYWNTRSRAFDLFQTVAERRRQEQRRSSAESHAVKLASKLYNKGEQVLADLENDDVSASEAVQIMKLALELETRATGMGKVDPEERATGKLDSAMRQAAIDAGDVIEMVEEGESAAMSEALQDPEISAKLQQIMLEAREKARSEENPN